jgi:hypothetical protein
MKLEQAIKILHPMTCEDNLNAVLAEAGYTANRICEAENEATILACEVMQREVERQAGCDWCINGAELTTGFLSDSDITPLQGLSGSTTYALRVGTEYRKINFCPMCGKPLNDGKVDGDG